VDFFHVNTEAFILRVWLERREIKNAFPHWRGMIEHVSTGERRYFNHINDIPKLIKPFLKTPSNELDPRESVGQRLKRIIYCRKKR
jgi:hypothetical protein